MAATSGLPPPAMGCCGEEGVGRHGGLLILPLRRGARARGG
jgi:hypothetical protein